MVCVLEFFTALIYTGGKRNSSVWRLRRVISMELLSVCAISSPPLLALVRLDALRQRIKRVFAHTRQKRTNAHWCDDSIPFYCILLFPRHIYAPFLKDSALCSCFGLFWGVFCLFFLNIYKYSRSFTLLWRVCWSVWVRSVQYQLMTRQMSIAATSNTSCLVFVPYDLTNAHTWRYVARGPKQFLLWPVWEQF